MVDAPRTAAPPAPRTAARFDGVEGLRGVAAGGVLLSHVYLYASPAGERYDAGPAGVLLRTSGTIGVVLFFTLSGFLLYRPFAAALLTGRRRPPLRAYFRNRLLRIFPGYWLALIVTGLVLRSAYLPPLEVQGRSLASERGALVANLLLVQAYSPSTLGTGIGPAWSLVVEMAFYLVLPLLALLAGLLATRTSPGRRWPWAAALAPAGVLLVVGQVGSQLMWRLPGAGGSTWGGSWHAVAARSFLTHASVFCAGVALAVLHTQLSRGAVVLPRWWRPAAWVAVPTVAVPTLLLFDGYRITENRATVLFSISCAVLLALVVLPRERRSTLVGLLTSRPLQWSGLVSYGVFLWHEPLIWFLRRQGWTTTGRDGFALALLLTVAVTGLAALLSWRLVEQPAMRLKRASTRVDTEGGLGTAEPGTPQGDADAPLQSSACSSAAPSPLNEDAESTANRSAAVE
jgi:peptidoglycan/LPS O-acetylase OafA/YrhL